MSEKKLEEMNGPELVETYNAMVLESGSDRLQMADRFDDLALGVRRCAELRRSLDSGSDLPVELRRYPCEGRDPNQESREERATTARVEITMPKRKRRLVDPAVFKEADTRRRNWMPKPGAMTRPSMTTFINQVKSEMKIEAVASPKSEASIATSSGSKRASKVIRTMVENPRRRGTEAHVYFEAMKGGPTVGEYLAKFKKRDQSKAARWLSNTVADGYAKLLG